VLRLRVGKIRRKSAPPMNRIPMRSVDGLSASHALPGSIQLGTGEAAPFTPTEGGVRTKSLPVLVSS
jgi:hypothetical protein